MTEQQSTIETLGKTLKCLGMISVLYPLERLQTIKQIQTTYADSSIRNHQSISAQAVHSGLKSFFRGFMSFITKAGLLTISSRITELHPKGKSLEENSKLMLTYGFATLGYLLTYPLELINIRMSVEVQPIRFYSNIRECASKIKKNEGLRTFYRSFFLGYSIFSLQLASVLYLQEGSDYLMGLSEWKKIGAIYGVIAAVELLLYPLTSLKKIYQINGAIGHTDDNFSAKRALKLSHKTSLWRGFDIRLANMLAYSVLYFTLVSQQTP